MRRTVFGITMMAVIGCEGANQQDTSIHDTASAVCSGLEIESTRVEWAEQSLLDAASYSARYGSRTFNTLWRDQSEHEITVELDWTSSFIELYSAVEDPNDCAVERGLPSYNVVAPVSVTGPVGVGGAGNAILEMRPQSLVGPQDSWYLSLPITLDGSAASIAGRDEGQMDLVWGVDSVGGNGSIPATAQSETDTADELFVVLE